MTRDEEPRPRQGAARHCLERHEQARYILRGERMVFVEAILHGHLHAVAIALEGADFAIDFDLSRLAIIGDEPSVLTVGEGEDFRPRHGSESAD